MVCIFAFIFESEKIKTQTQKHLNHEIFTKNATPYMMHDIDLDLTWYRNVFFFKYQLCDGIKLVAKKVSK